MSPNNIINNTTAPEAFFSWSNINSLLANKLVSLGFEIVFSTLLFFFIIVCSKIVARKVKSYITHAENTQLSQSAVIIGDIVMVLGVVIGLLLSFGILGFNTGPVLGGLTFGLGFASKDIIGNTMAGILVLSNTMISIGDIIEIQLDKGYFGRIESITARYTILRTFDLRQVVIPNTKIIASPIITYSREELVRMSIDIEVGYNANIDQVCLIISQSSTKISIIKDHSKTTVFLSGLGDNGFLIKMWFYVDPKLAYPIEYMKGIANKVITEELLVQNIDIPYTTIQVLS